MLEIVRSKIIIISYYWFICLKTFEIVIHSFDNFIDSEDIDRNNNKNKSNDSDNCRNHKHMNNNDNNHNDNADSYMIIIM